MLLYLLPAALALQAYAAPTERTADILTPRAAVQPQLASATYIGNVTDPTLSRDSCGSTRIGKRAFWTCRDTMAYKNGQSLLPITANTASWTNMSNAGGPAIKATGGAVGAGSTGTNPILQMYGGTPNKEYFPIQSDMCPGNHGFCTDGTRWVGWQDQPLLITKSGSDGSATGYTFMMKSHLSGLSVMNSPTAYSLYKSIYRPSSNPNTMPSVSLVSGAFWNAGEIGFGNYGSFVRNGYAYLYGQPIPQQNTAVALARVPVGSFENRNAYQYYNYTSSSWTSTVPSINDTTVIIPNAGYGGQGTFYYSTYYNSYIWIGQAAMEPVANFYITTAPAPEGPWITPYKIFAGQNGVSTFVGAYSLQAHPALLPSSNAAENGIYVTWTQPFDNGPYITPLAYLQFQ